MAEYIEREAVLKAYLDFSLAKSKAAKARKGVGFFQGELYPMVEITEKEWVRLIAAAPAADVAPVVHGEWIGVRNGKGICSHCNRLDSIDPLATHCRYCGADMRERKGDNAD